MLVNDFKFNMVVMFGGGKNPISVFIKLVIMSNFSKDKDSLDPKV